MRRFFIKPGDVARGIHSHDTEGACFCQRHLDAGHRAGRTQGHVVFNQVGVIHFVYMVARQHQNIFGIVLAQDIDILINRIGRAPVPRGLVNALLGRQQINELIDLAAQKRPAMLQMAQQAVRLVLCQHADAV